MKVVLFGYIFLLLALSPPWLTGCNRNSQLTPSSASVFPVEKSSDIASPTTSPTAPTVLPIPRQPVITPSPVPTVTAYSISKSTIPPLLFQDTSLSANITNEKGVPMVLIPAGQFLMGSQNGRNNEKPVHTAFLGAFYVDVHEVTNARYAECVSSGICQPPAQSRSNLQDNYYGAPQFNDFPVIYVSWEMAKTYCKWRGGELPSEAQWEKAARGGLQGMDFPWGNELPVCDKGAQNGTNYYGCSTRDTERVGSYSSNGYGLYDMAGNVWEWVWDFYSDSYFSFPSSFKNPRDPENGSYHVVRGGSWHFDPFNLRVANRGGYSSTYISNDIGFRCSRSP